MNISKNIAISTGMGLVAKFTPTKRSYKPLLLGIFCLIGILALIIKFS